MRKLVISAALLACVGTSGCQVFTAGETVSEPEPTKVRASNAAANDKAAAAPADALKGKQAEPAAAVESATAAHVLIRYAGAMRTGPEVTRSKEDARKLAQQVSIKASSAGADFAAIADEFTEDPSGKGRGGKLGTFGRGRMVPEFDRAVFDLSPGQASGVVETPFGFHVIYREK